MECPKCNFPVEKITFSNIEVDRCSSCKGIWFDLPEYGNLKSIKGSEVIDSGDPFIAMEYNKLDNGSLAAA